MLSFHVATFALSAPIPAPTFEPWTQLEGFRFEVIHQSKKPGSRVSLSYCLLYTARSIQLTNCSTILCLACVR